MASRKAGLDTWWGDAGGLRPRGHFCLVCGPPVTCFNGQGLPYTGTMGNGIDDVTDPGVLANWTCKKQGDVDRSVRRDAETPSFCYICIHHAMTFSRVYLSTTDCEPSRWIPLLAHRVEPWVATIIRLLRYILASPMVPGIAQLLSHWDQLPDKCNCRKEEYTTVWWNIVHHGREGVGTSGFIGAGVCSSDLLSSHFLVEEET